ncbi:MAG: hypothetical protein MZU97_26325 [Bacillus subtilis]|nr:hypothetical protein [Bacillus subtilis]
MYGSPKTIVYANTITNLTQSKSIGIVLSDAPYTYIVANTLRNIQGATEGIGIKINYTYYALDPLKGFRTTFGS